ncbi:MAG: UDP-N-acetylmuramoyl-L-alanyl-D-glutamate--2,6-diaminopimelate ligase [Alphaproteobacteria bacterium]|nr:UDP-N-acetylmuramoyl-L-alanyl-D-glutamate--2,6-diaminopimelate ligase [Alphaproteobacteria bacterium]
MFLNQLLTACGLSVFSEDIEITGITADSRKVEKGFLFAALPGVKADGIDFLPQAVEKGAAAAIFPKTVAVPDLPIIGIFVDDVRLTLARMAAAFYAPQPETVVAVTGTNGKTSTANFTRQLWEKAGKKAACIGTLGVVTEKGIAYGSLTTPDSVTLHQKLQTLAKQNYRHTAIEASSHGLDQHRIDGIRLAAAAFTNITRDHLDYHKTMENYLDAKLKLFDRPLSSGKVVLNADIDEYPQIKEYCLKRGLKILDYGKKAEAIKLTEARHETDGQHLELEVFGQKHSVHLPLAGTFQAMNALCALGLALATKANEENAADYVAALSTLKGAPGRLEFVGKRQNGASVYVDYAHTPDALKTILNALRPHTAKRLHVVFGCGGDRDPGKRPQMGAICNDWADVVYVTDDNPRSEEPTQIRSAILPACPKGMNIGSRALAIRTAVAGLEEGDILVIAGKGHETGQLIKGVMHPFDDREEARKAISEADTPLWTADEIVRTTGGKAAADFDIFGLSIDTRTLKKNDLFIALKGEKSDGHAHAAEALAKGAAGVLVSHIPQNVPESRAIVVENTLKALEDMAKTARRRTSAKIIGVTGSSGKTSTKEMLKTALSSVGKTHTTLGNLNNNIGMPLTLARMPKETDFAVIEMGISHAGEMTELTQLAEPDIAVITMIGTAHGESFKTREDTALAKAEIFKGMTAEGIVFLNADDAQYALLKKEAQKNGVKDIRNFGATADNAVVLLHIGETTEGTQITAKVNDQSHTYTLHLAGRHQAQNSLGVVGVLSALAVDMPTALQALGQLQPIKGRGQRLEIALFDGCFTLIDDAYNANPESMQAGIRVLGSMMPVNAGRRIAVIGDMLELGERAKELHKKLAADLIENKIDKVYTVGENSAALFDVLPVPMQGIKKPSSDELAAVIRQEIKSGDIVLVKGSFGSKMAKIVEALKAC